MKTTPAISGSQALGAIRSMFPCAETLATFLQNDPDVAARVLTAVTQMAVEHSLITHPSIEALTELIDNSSAIATAEGSSALAPQPIPPGFGFPELLERIASHRSIKQLVEHELRPWCRRLGLPDVQESMISRLRSQFRPNTPGKLNLLRAFAFWLGLVHPHWGWSFDRLLLLEHAHDGVQQFDHRNGVRLAFRIDGQGDLLEGEDLAWVRREILACLRDLEIFHVNQELVASSSTTAFVSLPKLQGQADNLAEFSAALRDAFALVHQMIVRWALQPRAHSSRLVIALHAGAFDQLDTPLQAMLRSRLGEGNEVRVSPFVRLCAALLDLKVLFAPQAQHVALFADEELSLWILTGIWSHLYYELVPPVEARLIAEQALLHERNQALRLATLPPPANSLVLLELAKGCLAMMHFHEAAKFCSIVLASDPEHAVARTMRLSAQLNSALAQPNLRTSWLGFRQAIADGELLIRQAQLGAEEVFCELGQVHFCMARRLFVLLVSGRERIILEAIGDELDCHTVPGLKKLIRDKLLLARDCFDRGRAVSASGMAHRALHWAFRIHALLLFLETEPEAFSLANWPEHVLTDRKEVFARCAIELFCSEGWLPPQSTASTRLDDAVSEKLLSSVLLAFSHYENAVLSKPYRANVKLALATLSFDFIPVLSVGLLKRILLWIDEATALSRALADKPAGARSIITCFSQVQPAQQLCDRAMLVRSFLLSLYANQLDLPDNTELSHGREHKLLLRAFASDESIIGGAC